MRFALIRFIKKDVSLIILDFFVKLKHSMKDGRERDWEKFYTFTDSWQVEMQVWQGIWNNLPSLEKGKKARFTSLLILFLILHKIECIDLQAYWFLTCFRERKREESNPFTDLWSERVLQVRGLCSPLLIYLGLLRLSRLIKRLFPIKP